MAKPPCAAPTDNRGAAKALAILLMIPLAGCGTAPLADGVNPDPRCHPLAPAATTCALPFPSSFYLNRDAAAATGWRVALPADALPKNPRGEPLEVARFNRLDGFSPATQILADLGARIDPASLPGVDQDPALSLRPESTVQLLRYEDGQRVPLFAEVDAHVKPGDSAAQLLLVHPLVRLQPRSRYVVALRGLRAADGSAITVPPFQALVSGRVADGSRLAGERERSDEILAFMERASVPRDALTLAWDFRTGSDEQITAPLLRMRDLALARWDRDGLGVSVTRVEESSDDPLLLRRILLTFKVPSFLTSDSDDTAGLDRGADGLPRDSGRDREVPLRILIPRCAATAPGPLRVVVYGHGLLSDNSEIEAAVHRSAAQRLCVIEVATDFVGLASGDLPALGGALLGAYRLGVTGDRLLQAQINFAVLARVARRRLPALAALTVDGKPGGRPLINGQDVYYLGASQGGIFGNTILAVAPDLQAGALVVPGATYSLMLPRSADYVDFEELLQNLYPEPETQQLLLALSQMFWDGSDPIHYAAHNLRDGLPGPDGRPLPPRQVLLQESIGDCKVPNVATRLLARTMGIPLLGAAVEPVYGVRQQAGPLPSAYAQFDVSARPLPARSNVAGEDNGAHAALGRVPAALDQLDGLLREGGQVVNTCGGPCVFPFPKE